MKLFYFFIILLIIGTGAASAHDISIVNDTDFNIGNGVYITVLAPLNFTTTSDPAIQIHNSSDSPANTLEFDFNGKLLRFSASQNATISINSYDVANDVYNITVQSGTVDLSAQVAHSNTAYNFFQNGVYNAAVTSNGTGWISKTGMTGGAFSWPNQYTPPSVPSDTNLSNANGAAGGANPSNPLNNINISNLTAPIQPYLNINSLAEDSTGLLIFQILFALGFLMVSIFILRDNIKTGTLISGMILMGFSYYIVQDEAVSWILHL